MGEYEEHEYEKEAERRAEENTRKRWSTTRFLPSCTVGLEQSNFARKLDL